MPTSMSSSEPQAARPVRERKLTGRMVLLCLIGFFGTIATVNTVMIRAALSTSGGAEKISSYRAGLNFARDRDAANAQKRLNWQVNIALPHMTSVKATEHQGCATEQNACAAKGPVEARVTDANGQPVAGLDATLILIHPTDSRRDQYIPMIDKGNGAYNTEIDTTAGRWSIDLDLDRKGEQMFRSSSRVVLN